MKRLCAALMAASILTMSMTSAFARQGDMASMSVSSLKANKQVEQKVTDTFLEEMIETTDEFVINDVMVNLKNLTATKNIVQRIQVRSTIAPVDCWLKLELPAESAYALNGGESAVNYYSLKIDRVINNGYATKTVYDESIDEAQLVDGAKLIHLGTIDDDTRVSNAQGRGLDFEITVSVNKSIDTASLADKPEDVQWKLVYTDNEKNFEPEVTPAPAVTTTTEPMSGVLTTAKPDTTSSPSIGDPNRPAEEKKEKVINIAVTAKETKEDSVKPGTYRLIGDGDVVITNVNGTRRAGYELSPELDKAISVTVKEGEKLTLTGDESAYIQFKSPAVATMKPTATPKVAKATATPSITAAPKATALPTAAAKVNPKTGDSAPIVAVSSLAMLALAVVVYILATSKKKIK